MAKNIQANKKKRRSKGNGTIFKRPNGNYCVQYTDITGKKKTIVLTLKDAATGKMIPIRNIVQAEVAARSIIEDNQKVNKLESKAEYLAVVGETKKLISQVKTELDEIWVTFKNSPARKDAGESTLKGYKVICNLFFNWVKKNHPNADNISKIDEDIAEKYFTQLWQSGMSEQTYNNHLQVLTLIFKTLCNKDNQDETPFKNIERKTSQNQKREAFSPSELTQIFNFLAEDNTYHMLHKPQMRAMIKLMVYTGCRGEDACIMEWSSIKLDKNIISYTPEKNRRRKPKLVSLPIHPELRKELDNARQWLGTNKKEEEYIIPAVAARYKNNPSGISKDIMKLLEATGITARIDAGKNIRRKLHVTTDAKGKAVTKKMRVCKFSMHSFRHTFVSICAEAGIPLAVVQAIVGHASEDMTRYYTHISDERMAKAINTLPMPGTVFNQVSGDIIDVDAIPVNNNLEPERSELMKLISSADIATVKEILKKFKTDRKIAIPVK